MSSVEDAGDLLADVYDQLAAPRHRRAFADGSVDAWYHDEWVAQERDRVALAVREIGGVTAAMAQRLRDHGGPGLLAILLGLDDAFAEILFPPDSGVSPGMQEYSDRWIERRLLNDRPASGAVLPRWAAPGRDSGGNSRSPRDVLAYTTRVSQAVWQDCQHVIITRFHDVTCGPRDIRVGCVPFLEDLKEVDLQVIPRGVDRGYRAQAADTASLRERIPGIIETLEEARADIGVLPECATSAELLSVWHDALRGRHLRHLRWILIGTGLFPTGGRRPASRAVLISTRDGTMIAHQDKQFGFTLSPRHVSGWGLDSIPSGTWDESLAFGVGLTVIDSMVLRAAIAVCEDVTRAELVPVVRSAGITVLFVPIFAREIDPGNWEQFGAEEHVSESGAHVVVANSIAVARRRAEIARAAAGTHSEESAAEDRDASTFRYSLFVPSASQIGTYVPVKEGRASSGGDITMYEMFAEE